jgi:hypothetical protein
MQSKITNFTRKNSNDNLRLEHCMANTCAEELFIFSKENNINYAVYEWLITHESLEYGTKVELIKLYSNNELVGYASIENFESRNDKTNYHQGIAYQELGLIHFVTSLNHRNKGFATLLSNAFYSDIIKPLLERHDNNSFIISTGRATPLIERTGINMDRVLLEFYSDASFIRKVVNTRKINRDIAA